MKIMALISVLSLGIGHFALADGSVCQTSIDCKTHKIKVITSSGSGDPSTQEATVDCGKGDKPEDYTYDGTGTIGGSMHVPLVGPSGVSVDEIDINGIDGMGTCGATNGEAKVMHAPPSKGAEPKGADSSLGCIHIPAKFVTMLQGLNNCSLTISGAHDPKQSSPPPQACGAAGGQTGSFGLSGGLFGSGSGVSAPAAVSAPKACGANQFLFNGHCYNDTNSNGGTSGTSATTGIAN